VSINARRLSRIHERVAVALDVRPERLEIGLHYDRAGNAEKTYLFAMAAGRHPSTCMLMPKREPSSTWRRTAQQMRTASDGDTEPPRSTVRGKVAGKWTPCERSSRPRTGLALPNIAVVADVERGRGNRPVVGDTIKVRQAPLIDAIAMGSAEKRPSSA
jgi:hypothetical protein